METIAFVLLVATGAAAALMLRRAWADRRRDRAGFRVAGWGVLLASGAIASALIGPALGIAYAVAAEPVGALMVVAFGATLRAAREARTAQLAPEPLEGRSRAWRGWLKALLAGPLGMLAAMGVAFCYASRAPGAVQTRLLIAALLVPALWGLAMTWTLADQRLLRSAAVLAGTAALGFGLAFVGGLA